MGDYSAWNEAQTCDVSSQVCEQRCVVYVKRFSARAVKSLPAGDFNHPPHMVRTKSWITPLTRPEFSTTRLQIWHEHGREHLRHSPTGDVTTAGGGTRDTRVVSLGRIR